MLDKLRPMARSAYSTETTIQHTYDMTMKVMQDEISGVLVECGVAAGAQIGVMARAVEDFGGLRQIWAYDSFQGIPLATADDDEQPGVGPLPAGYQSPANPLVSSGITSHSRGCVVQNLTRWGFDLNAFRFVEGWFQNTLALPENRPHQIALLRLDGDLYESTKVCMEWLYPLVAKGGVVIVDDYHLGGCRKAIHQYLDKNRIKVDIYPVSTAEKTVHWWRVS